MNSRKTKIGTAFSIESTTSNNFIKSKIAKVMLPKTASKAKVFLTLKAKQIFTKLGQVFGKASILYYFDSKYYIYIKSDGSKNVKSEILS